MEESIEIKRLKAAAKRAEETNTQQSGFYYEVVAEGIRIIYAWQNHPNFSRSVERIITWDQLATADNDPLPALRNTLTKEAGSLG